MSSTDDMSKYPPNSRIFIGNLPSEKTSKAELEQIFSKYGKVYDVILRRSFGFVQFDSAESAIRAIEGEQGRIIGGLKIGRFHYFLSVKITNCLVMHVDYSLCKDTLVVVVVVLKVNTHSLDPLLFFFFPK
jgi:RNA recognition motif-containing protein